MKNYENVLNVSYDERIKNTCSALSIAQAIYKKKRYKFHDACREFERRFLFDIDIKYTENDFEEITLIRKQVIHKILICGREQIENIEL